MYAEQQQTFVLRSCLLSAEVKFPTLSSFSGHLSRCLQTIVCLLTDSHVLRMKNTTPLFVYDFIVFLSTVEYVQQYKSVDAFILICLLSSGLSPRDLILHFRHKVENYSHNNNVEKDLAWLSVVYVKSLILILPSGCHPLQAHSAGEEGLITNLQLLYVTQNMRSDCFDFCCFVRLQVLFYVSPVNRLVGALMTVLSLFPG